MSPSIGNVASHAARAGGRAARQLRSAVNSSDSRPAGADRTPSGWLVVTVFRDPSEVDVTELPEPLSAFDDRIEVCTGEAAGGKGTELAVRLRNQASSGTAAGRLVGSDAEADLRSALRRAKQLIEVGEVLAVDPAPHGDRTMTPAGVLLETWTKVAPKGGVR